MASPQERIPVLTRSERKVLADLQLLQNKSGKATLSSRNLAELTGLSGCGVRKAIDRLNELQLIKTYTGSVNHRPSEHTVLWQVPVRQVSENSKDRS